MYCYNSTDIPEDQMGSKISRAQRRLPRCSLPRRWASPLLVLVYQPTKLTQPAFGDAFDATTWLALAAVSINEQRNKTLNGRKKNSLHSATSALNLRQVLAHSCFLLNQPLPCERSTDVAQETGHETNHIFTVFA
jgi:hypothetical protein